MYAGAITCRCDRSSEPSTEKQVVLAELNKESEEQQKQSMKRIKTMVKINVETLETITRQIEQIEGQLTRA